MRGTRAGANTPLLGGFNEGCHLQCIKQVGGSITSVSKSYGT